MIETDRFAKVQIASLRDLHDWLAANHAQEESVWMVRYKQHVADRYVGRLEALDELMAFGWIDGIARKLDDDRTMQLISPRRQQVWTQTYRDRAARLEAEGRMQESGRAAVRRSQDLGLWEADADVDALLVPVDLTAALRMGNAETNFAEAPPSYRRNVLRWIKQAKKPETRAARIERTVDYAQRNARIPQM
jgi:uncharacterized protein YdeI (YjbR/CyaY-like superfamily)